MAATAPTPLQRDAAKELLARRRSRSGLLDFVKYTFPRFKENWHHETICKALERVDRGEIKRLMIFAPPRHTKTELVSIRRPAWSIGRDRTRMFINVTYGSRLARTFSRACQSTINSPPYQRLWPVKLDRTAVEKWKVERTEAEENQRDSMIASGILTPMTGEGATDINIDDPFKNKSEAYSKLIRNRVYDEYLTSIRTRLQPGGTICLMMTRWHQDDLAGRLLAAAEKNPKADQWVVIVLPATNDSGQEAYILDTATNQRVYFPPYAALWPEWFDREALDATKAVMANAFWMAMYQQSPTRGSGNIFKRENWGEFARGIRLDRCIQIWDTASSESENADWSAFEEMGIADGRFCITDAARGHWDFPDLTKEVYRRWKAATSRGVNIPERLVIENKSSGIALIQTIEANNVDPYWNGPRIPVQAMPATLDKTVRALSVSGYHDSQMVALPTPEMVLVNGVWQPVEEDADDWLADFIEEHAEFPTGMHDDWVDCTVHGLTYFTRPIAGEVHEEIIVDENEARQIIPELDYYGY